MTSYKINPELGKIDQIKRAIDALRVINDSILTLQKELNENSFDITVLYKLGKTKLEELKK